MGQGASVILWNYNANNGGAFGPPQPLFDQMVASGRARLVFPVAPQEETIARGYRVYELVK